MNEIQRDDTNPQPISSGLLELLLKLWFILMLVFMGLWVLGVILMYWYLVVPAGILIVVWAWWSDPPPENGQASRARSAGGLPTDLLLKTIDDRMHVDIEKIRPHEQLDQVEPTFAQLDLADECLGSTEFGGERLL